MFRTPVCGLAARSVARCKLMETSSGHDRSASYESRQKLRLLHSTALALSLTASPGLGRQAAQFSLTPETVLRDERFCVTLTA